MFMSQYNHTIDEKGRIFIPSRYRDALGENFVLTYGMDGCLYIYPNEEWETFVEGLRALKTGTDSRKLQRYFLAGAVSCELDKQGRVLIPANLRAHAGLEKDVVFVGVLDKIEVWSKENWEANNSFENVDQLVDEMAKNGAVF